MATGAVQEDDSFVKQVQINQSAQQCFSKIIDVIDRKEGPTFRQEQTRLDWTILPIEKQNS